MNELLNRELIAIDIAAKLGREIKDSENLTAEEREYIDKRDLIGVRIQEYINRNPIPEDEDKEPQYSRELNRHVKDLLGVKERSTPVRMDNPKKASEKLLQHYQGDKLKELIKYLMEGAEPSSASSSQPSPNFDLPILLPAENVEDKPVVENVEEIPIVLNYTEDALQAPNSRMQLTFSELAERLQRSKETIKPYLYKATKRDSFSEWTRKHDPENIAWQRDEGNGKTLLFVPVPEQ